ncbi:hypothetical protein VPH207E341_0021 [Vibrio phage 207E34-1]
MKTVTGQVSFHVYVDCHHCKENLDLITENDGNYDYDNCITDDFFDNKGDGWDTINEIMVCHHCDGEFTLNKLEY